MRCSSTRWAGPGSAPMPGSLRDFRQMETGAKVLQHPVYSPIRKRHLGTWRRPVVEGPQRRPMGAGGFASGHYRGRHHRHDRRWRRPALDCFRTRCSVRSAFRRRQNLWPCRLLHHPIPYLRRSHLDGTIWIGSQDKGLYRVGKPSAWAVEILSLKKKFPVPAPPMTPR